MIDRLIRQRAEQDAEEKRRAELYPDEAQHGEGGAVAFWQCRGCGKVNPVVLGEDVKALKCGCKVSVIINKREDAMDESSVLWYSGPVI